MTWPKWESGTRTVMVNQAGLVLALALVVWTLFLPAATESNRWLGLNGGGGEPWRVTRAGESEPFAILPSGSVDGRAVVRARLEGSSPFVFVDIAPRTDDPNAVVGKLELGPVRLAGVDSTTWRAMGTGGLTNLAETVGSYAFLALADPATRKGYVAAWLTDEWASGSVFYGAGGLSYLAEYGPMRAGRDATRKVDTLVLGAFDDCRLGLEAYADAVAARHAIVLPRQISGFCTWYCDKGGYGNPKGYGACDETQTREFIDKVVSLGLGRWGFDYYQIDDKWQDGKERHGPAMLFSHTRPNGPYPNGMKPTVDAIVSRGIRAGLWYMPFSGDPDEPWWAERTNLFVKSAVDAPPARYRLRQRKGAPYMTPFGSGALDMSNPAAIDYVKETIARITREWGFRLIKFDGMYSGMAVDLGHGRAYVPDDIGNQVFHDPEVSNVQAFRRGLRAMREAMSTGTQLLACNVKQHARGIAASYGLVEMLRIGGDNGPIDTFPQRYMAGPLDGSPRYFLNGRVWYNDPDPVYVRDAVPIGRARLMASWTALGGLLYNFSDWLPWLSEKRIEILKRTMAPHRKPRQVRPVDYFDRTIPNVWKLTDSDCAVFGLYNWSTNAALTVDYPAAFCDLDPEKTYVGFDFWGNAPVAPFKGRLVFAVPQDDCRVIAVCEFDGTRPVVVSTSRHVASPIFDVADESWDASALVLSGVSTTVTGELYELRIIVPEGLDVASAGEGDVRPVREGRLLRLRFANPMEIQPWRIAFRRR